MKILIFGEFSGLSNCLKDGFITLGHQVYLVSEGDGTKDYPSDLRWDVKCKIASLSKLLGYVKLFLHRKKLCGYDVALFVSTSMSKYIFINKFFYGLIINRNKTVYWVGSGLNATSNTYWLSDKKFKYYNYASKTRFAKMSPKLFNDYIQWERYLLDKIDGLIPIWYEYAQPFRDYPKLLPAIRIPVNIDKFEYKPNRINGKIVFFHGISRASKGGEFILAAFEKLRKKYKDEAEFIAKGNLPFDEYMKIIDRTNVIVDDANSYSFAMNVLFSMAKGKICVGGAEPESNNELGYKYNPVVNIKADVNQIASALENIIKNKDKIEEWGHESRKFVEEYHNYLDICRIYIALFDKNLRNI